MPRHHNVCLSFPFLVLQQKGQYHNESTLRSFLSPCFFTRLYFPGPTCTHSYSLSCVVRNVTPRAEKCVFLTLFSCPTVPVNSSSKPGMGPFGFLFMASMIL